MNAPGHRTRRAVGLVVLALACAATPAATQQPYADTAPPVALRGFIDFGHLWTTGSAPSGFAFGALLGEIEYPAGPKLDFVGTLGLGPEAGGWRLDLERAVVRYRLRDDLALAAGRLYTPIGYWNSALGRGGWHFTSIAAPAPVDPRGGFLPVHSVGLLAEGRLPTNGRTVRYTIGIANGRGGGLDSAGDAGAANGGAAWLARLGTGPAPDARGGWRLGATIYDDRVASPAGAEPVHERILAAHVAFAGATRSPELLAEYALVLHDDAAGAEHASRGGYLQLAHGLPGTLSGLTPYLRLERIAPAAEDPLYPPGELDYDARLLGARYDFAETAAIKAEFLDERGGGAAERVRGLRLQLSLGIGAVAGPEPPTVLAAAESGDSIAPDETPASAADDPQPGDAPPIPDADPADDAGVDADSADVDSAQAPAVEAARSLANAPVVPLNRAVAIVVHPDTPVDGISLPELRRIFRGERQSWAGDEPIVLVVRALLEMERSVVLDRLYQMNDEDEFRRFWLSRIFDGELAAPPRMVSDLETARRLVTRLRGAISFMPASEVGPGVRLLPVDGTLPGEADYPLQR